MFDTTIFDSRNSLCKTPFGAVSAGTDVKLTIHPLRADGYSHAKVKLRYEFEDDRLEVVDMPWVDTDYVRDSFSATVNTGAYVGLVWYSFLLTGLDGRKLESKEYQLTVYDGTDRVPDWFGKGVCYQILPDRFYRTRIPDPTGLVGGRTVHENWGDAPIVGAVRKTPRGEDICNRDFFGGDLKGIEEKLPYLASLGVETLYFCPIFEASENHRYGTADYSRIDPMLGTNEDFVRLCDKAHAMGMRVLLDGVFNHTGWVSRYFNGDGFYGDSVGAAQSEDSPYRSWFNFKRWPEKYESWWGIYSLPETNENDPGYREFIYNSPESVVRTWMRRGADGWRLDVADELPCDFIAGVHDAIRAEKPDGAIIGEVWEDGTTKIAYGVRKKHLLGGYLDGLMNYPFRTALIDFLLGGDGGEFKETMETLRENYPPFAFNTAMNSLGTHDTLRILTYLGVGSPRNEWTKDRRGGYKMTPAERKRGKELLKLGSAVLFAFPGAPTVYYGDEVGMEGFEDPFNRYGYPWGKEDKELVDWFTNLGLDRKGDKALREGDLCWGTCSGGVLSFTRRGGKGCCAGVAVNRGDKPAVVELPWPEKEGWELSGGECHRALHGVLKLTVPAMGVVRVKSTPATHS